MNIGINDLDDDDFGMGFEPSLQVNLPGQEPDPQNPPSQEDNNEDFMSDFLRTRGIDDISKIKFEDDNGNIEERSWDLLTKEEKFNILNTPLENVQDNNNGNVELSEDEIQLLSAIRQSNLTPQLYIDQIKGLKVETEPLYKIDDLSDDELFLLDLESRVGELSEDVAAEALNAAKQNEELFKKQVEGIRKEYKEREDFLLQLQEAEYLQLQEEAYNLFLDSVINSINQFDSIGNLSLNFDDSDRDELAQFMLSRDETGTTYLWQALQDPDTLVKAAWFILNGDDALNSISDYFTNLIKLVSLNQYKKGFEEGKNGLQPSRPLVVINNKQKQNLRSIKDIDDLDDED